MVKIIRTNRGSHGDHWGAYYGFKTKESNPGIIIENLPKAFLQNKPSNIINGYTLATENWGKVDCVAIGNGKHEIETTFPVLKTEIILPFVCKGITEWEHVNGIEADIEGKGRDAFGLKFFATDFLKNESVYKSTEKFNVNLTGLAFELKETGPLPDNFSEDFVGYSPNHELMSGVINIIGKVVSFEKYKNQQIEGFIIKTKLINHDAQEDYFYLDIFANKENMLFNEPTIGMSITGIVWLQGKIAE